jgi:hypothetical protein
MIWPIKSGTVLAEVFHQHDVGFLLTRLVLEVKN